MCGETTQFLFAGERRDAEAGETGFGTPAIAAVVGTAAIVGAIGIPGGTVGTMFVERATL